MEFGVVTRVGLPHFPEDLQPALAEAAQRAGMGFTALSSGLVIDLSPTAKFAAQVRPKVDCCSQRCVTMPADSRFVQLAGLEADWRSPGVALKGLSIFESSPILADLR
jgi:hypothetical protein